MKNWRVYFIVICIIANVMSEQMIGQEGKFFDMGNWRISGNFHENAKLFEFRDSIDEVNEFVYRYIALDSVKSNKRSVDHALSVCFTGEYQLSSVWDNALKTDTLNCDTIRVNWPYCYKGPLTRKLIYHKTKKYDILTLELNSYYNFVIGTIVLDDRDLKEKTALLESIQIEYHSTYPSKPQAR